MIHAVTCVNTYICIKAYFLPMTAHVFFGIAIVLNILVVREAYVPLNISPSKEKEITMIIL